MGQTGQRSIVEDRPCGRMRRLPPAFYQGYAFVHWNMTLQERSCGWLSPAFHQRFREIQLHTLSRYRLFCLCYCLMPDHLHLLWAGLDADSDQDKAATFFRKYLNRALAEAGAARLSAPGDEETTLSQTGAGSGSAPSSVQGAARLPAPALQKQAWDVVLREQDRARGAVEKLLFYIAENPVRKGHVSAAQEWAFSGSQAAGFPDLDWRDEQFRDRLWSIYETEVDRNRKRFRSGQVDGYGAVERTGYPPEPAAAPLRRTDAREMTTTGSGAAARAGTQPEPKAAPLQPSAQPPTTAE